MNEQPNNADFWTSRHQGEQTNLLATDIANSGVGCHAQSIAEDVDRGDFLTVLICESADWYIAAKGQLENLPHHHAALGSKVPELCNFATVLGQESQRDVQFILVGASGQWRLQSHFAVSDCTNHEVLWTPTIKRPNALSAMTEEEFRTAIREHARTYKPDRKLTSRASELRAQLLSLSKVTPALDASYLVKGWLGHGAMSVIYGPSNSGKTFVVLDIAMHVASGAHWRGCRVEQGPVLYIAAEGGSGIKNRLVALKQERPEFSDAPLFVLPTALDFFSDGDVKALCDVLDEPPILIVVDTLARSMGQGDENSTKDMSTFVKNGDLLRKETGAHVLIVHHTGKNEDRGARGASALKAAVDTEILITSNHQITPKKQRDLPLEGYVSFSLRPVTIGTDQDGDEITSCVVDVADARRPQVRVLKGQAEVAMNALHDAIRDHGERMFGEDYPHDCTAVHIDRWKDACGVHGLTTGGSDSAARTAFMRVKNKLLDFNQIRIFGDYVWRVFED